MSAAPLLRSSVPAFQFKMHCIFCGDVADAATELKKPRSRRREISEVLTTVFQDTVQRIIHDRDDEWSNEVKHRINAVDVRALDGRYHRQCYAKFAAKPNLYGAALSAGRPTDECHETGLCRLLAFIDENDECQYSINELVLKLSEYLPMEYPNMTRKTLKMKLEKHYGDRVVITSVPGGNSILTFLDVNSQILNDHWYKARVANVEDERQRIIETAACIIREDILKSTYDTENYENVNTMFSNAQTLVPQSLRFFIETVVMKRKRGELSNWMRKCLHIEHCIIAATRPRSFVSTLQVGLSVHLHREFASRRLIDILHALGVASSYAETKLYEASILANCEPVIAETAFVQFVFDNADFNSRTLDGLGTFHCMGGLQCVTPADDVQFAQSVPRSKSLPSASEVAHVGHIPLREYFKPNNCGLSKIEIMPVSRNEVPMTARNAENLDYLWLLGSVLEVEKRCGWSGFMECAASGLDTTFETSSTLPLPFILSPASDPSTIYTALLHAASKCRSIVEANTACFVTFDQPLYCKAADIVEASGPGGELSSVIVRLGGFHMLMSYFGSIGSIMAGSGIEELWTTVYAGNSVGQMLSGHAYARAARAHSLTQLALVVIALDDVMDDKDQTLASQIRTAYCDTLERKVRPEDATNIEGSVLSCRLQSFLKTAASRSRTAKLWLQYFEQVELIRLFIRAERLGDWELHLYCVRSMLPYFHAAGHIHYAKSAQLYLQQMLNIQARMSATEFQRFTADGFFTVRRSSKLWAGVWSDMTIEQVLMRSMKSRGGVTRGRGVTESVLSRWTQTMPACSTLSDRFDEFCGVRACTSEQHVELRDSRRCRDSRDLGKFVGWLEGRSPFCDGRIQLMSLSNGVIGDHTINCDAALEAGLSSMSRMTGQTFGKVKLKRSDKVRTLSMVSGGVKVKDEIVSINPMQLFSRIICVVKSAEELVQCLKHELAPRPPSLFSDTMMRKPNKAALCKILEERSPCLDSLPEGCSMFVLDGGHLLHRVVWHYPATYSAICNSYIRYIMNHYGLNVTVVFDGYLTTLNTKAEEHRRRAEKGTCADVVVEGNMSVNTTQAKFLANPKNKSQFISLLGAQLIEGGITVFVADADADGLIVNKAIALSNTQESASVVIVGEDTDLLVLLVSLAPRWKNILLLKPGSVRRSPKIYSSYNLQQALGDLTSSLLFTHAMSGCDTTSAPYGKGKKKAFALMDNDRELREEVAVFNYPDSSPDAIAVAGEKFLLALYGAAKGTGSLNELRYYMYHSTTAKRGLGSNFQLASLPPTSAAARQHSFRVYHQVQLWRGIHYPETQWGWRVVCGSNLFPVTTLEAAAPETLLKLIYCQCKAECVKVCRCRKAGLRCSPMCGQCRGLSCHNPSENSALMDDDILDDIEADWNDDGISYTGMEVIID